MFRSKADLILSRYRPIAPKPPPLPPSGSFTTDLSSTCASLDSFASSSGKLRRPRKRRIAPSSSGKSSKSHKTEKPHIASAAVSINNAGVCASSLTQGNSDATVPRADLSHVSHSFGMQGHVSTSPHMMIDVSERARLPSGDSAVLATPFTHHLAGNILEQARMFMVSDARKVRQLPFLPLSPHPRGQDCASGGIIEKDVAFMDRAAASTVLPDRIVPSQGLTCGGVCMKGVGYGGGGFTEMIRGITHLPTAADVQSLMQARSGGQAAEMGMVSASAENSPCRRTASPVYTETHLRRLESHSHVPTDVATCWNSGWSVRASEVEDFTLSLLPNVPSKPALSAACLPAASVMHDSSSRLEPLADQTMDLHVGVAAGGSSANVPVALVAGSQGGRDQVGRWKQVKPKANDVDMPLHPCLLPTSKLQDGVVPSCTPPVLSRDGATVDQVYLQQVYGGSTDPVLLLDDRNQVLWFNKAYDRALKSVSDRLSNKPVVTGPYIDPLGHPTPLGSLALNLEGDVPKSVNATLWGFLRKLVMPELVSPPPMMRHMKVGVSVKDPHSKALDSSGLSLSVGDGLPSSIGERSQQSNSHACSNSSIPACRTVDVTTTEVQGYGGVGKLTTVTLESITEVFMGEGMALAECVEAAETRLAAAGSVPAFITDCTSRVRWINAAFKHMFGHLEQQGNSMLSHSGAVAKHEPPDLTLVCSAERIPQSARAFAGLVNLEWMKAGKRRSMTVPCDVSRLVPAATWVWKFDVALSLSLNLCV